MPKALPDFTCWLLNDARAALAGEPEWAALAVRVVETAPPVKRPPADKKPGKPKAGAEPKREFQATRPGQWRVLRSRPVDGEIELLVAREELRAEDRATQSEPGIDLATAVE